jgi:predicted transcriptional regulator
MRTTIQVSDRLKKRLQRQKRHPRQAYEEVIQEALDFMEENELELSPSAREALEESRRQFAKGRFKTLEGVKKELGL